MLIHFLVGLNLSFAECTDASCLMECGTRISPVYLSLTNCFMYLNMINGFWPINYWGLLIPRGKTPDFGDFVYYISASLLQKLLLVFLQFENNWR